MTDPHSGFGEAYGYYSDAETGLSLLGRRYYDTATGRFINRDPLGYLGGADLYAYCNNNPIMAADPNTRRDRRSCSPKSILPSEATWVGYTVSRG